MQAPKEEQISSSRLKFFEELSGLGKQGLASPAGDSQLNERHLACFLDDIWVVNVLHVSLKIVYGGKFREMETE
jgi:hypothetical protein